jgi:putative restriction endonuclease
MEGFIAVTDQGWYEHLRATPGPMDANFWRPSPRIPVRLEIGTPFFFKLKAPHNAIAGFGYFAGFSVLPDWLAWETFGAANGVGDLRALRDRLSRIQAGARIAADPSGRIGCSMIAEATFFDPVDWVFPPRDWRARTQTGARYDLGVGEGLRIWTECHARASRQAPLPTGILEPGLVAREAAPRYGAPSFTTPRLGQGIFRVSVLSAYRYACAVTSEHSLPVLEAAHIRPYADGGGHLIPNGLSLRSDLHRLFDRGYVTVDENYRFVVGNRLREDFENGRSYYGLKGTALSLPSEKALQPSLAALEWHRAEVFLG